MRMLMTCLLAAGGILAQQLDLSSLDKLAANARESSNVTLDQEKLKLVSQLSGNAPVQDALSGLNSVLVRTFEFDKPGAWSASDLEPIRQQLKGTGWSKIIEMKERDEMTEIHVFTGKGGQPEGMAVIAGERDELTVVNLVGSNLAALSRLSGKLGIPNISSDLLGATGGKPPRAPKSPSPAAPRKEDE